ncbi:MAG: hypothetical protein QOJ81_1871 [Chloroflexota bacterium]|jgi:uncharacterized BrkB/YihY/UPF0761 family membrane protein|nr:hypothetical protein [Chloroflexota bacterium]
MSDSLLFLIVGLLISIPLTIVLNLATPRIERGWGSRSEQKAKQLADREGILRERARNFQHEPAAFTRYLWDTLFSIVRGLLIGLVVVVLFFVYMSGLSLSNAFDFPDATETTRNFLSTITGFGVVGVALIVVLIYRVASADAREAMRLIKLVGGLPIEDERPETERELL